MILIKNVTLFDGEQILNNKDVLVGNTKVLKVSDKIDKQEAITSIGNSDNELIVIDGKNKLLSPGFVDVHVHLREPGYEYKETIITGSEAAARGGFTTVCCMPNTKPITDNVETVSYINDKAKLNNGVRILPIGAITLGESGEKLTDFDALQKAGIVALSDDGRGVQDSFIMQIAFNKAKELNLPIIIHAEDEQLVRGGHIHEGKKSKEYNLKGIPSTSESVMVARDILLAKSADAHVHFAHLSAKESVEIIAWAKKQGINVTCEVTPQHLTMSENDIVENNGVFKVNPPLRTMEDQNALVEAFNIGIIDIIATDHAPHSELEKNQTLDKAYFGMTGLETAFAVLYTKLVITKKVSLTRLLASMTIKPASIFNLDCGYIKPDTKADLVLIDLEQIKNVKVDDFKSKATNSPFIGWELQGWPVMTIINGKIVFDEIMK